MCTSWLLLVLALPQLSIGDLIYTLEDVRTLSEMPLERLLVVQRSLEPKPTEDDEPEAMALVQPKNPDRSGYEEYEEHEDKGGGDKKDIQGFFQMAVTALAFLAFGGYLLCLIVQAIKSKKMDQMTQMASMQMMAALIRKQALRRRRPATKLRKTKNKTKVTKNNGNRKRPRRETVDVWPTPDPEKMYHTLITLSEAYKIYHTVDYSRFNQSSRYFT